MDHPNQEGMERYAKIKGFKITNLGVSKPPCCMCDTVLSSERQSPGWNHYTARNGVTKARGETYHTEVHNDVFSTCNPVASGPQTGWEKDGHKRWFYDVEQTDYRQYGSRHDKEWGHNKDSWYHPIYNQGSWNTLNYVVMAADQRTDTANIKDQSSSSSSAPP